MKSLFVVALVAAFACAPGALLADNAAPAADEFPKVLSETATLWQQGQLGEVKKNLDYLSQLVAQKRLKQLQTFLPQAPAGWTASAVEGQAVGAAMLGGGTSVSRTYTNQAGAQVKIEITGDNPALAQMMALFANPMIAQSSGAEVMRIGREQALYQDNELKFMTNGFLIDVSGSGSKDAKVWFANAINLQALAAFK